MLRIRLLLLPATLAASICTADSIVLNGDHIDNVYIIESSRAVYVCNPADGTARSLAKTDPALGEITISKDDAARETLRAQYQARKTEREQEQSPTPAESHATSIEIQFEPSAPSAKPYIPTSTTPELRLKGEPGSASRIGLPDLPALASQNAPGGGMAGGGGNAGGGAMATGSGGGARGGGAGGGGAGGQGTGFGFRNISDLFDSTDDASVGETPNPITGR